MAPRAEPVLKRPNANERSRGGNHSETALVAGAVNETRFQYYRSATQAIANSLNPATLVLQSFNGGGSALGRTFDTQNNYELQNYTSLLKGRHGWRFGSHVKARGLRVIGEALEVPGGVEWERP